MQRMNIMIKNLLRSTLGDELSMRELMLLGRITSIPSIEMYEEDYSDETLEVHCGKRSLVSSRSEGFVYTTTSCYNPFYRSNIRNFVRISLSELNDHQRDSAWTTITVIDDRREIICDTKIDYEVRYLSKFKKITDDWYRGEVTEFIQRPMRDDEDEDEYNDGECEWIEGRNNGFIHHHEVTNSIHIMRFGEYNVQSTVYGDRIYNSRIQICVYDRSPYYYPSNYRLISNIWTTIDTKYESLVKRVLEMILTTM